MLSVSTFVFNSLQENTYIVSNENLDCVIIDAGNYAASENEEIIGHIESRKLKPKMLLSTHSHIDHVMGNSVLSKRYGIPLAACPVEREYYDKVWMYAEVFGIKFTQDMCIYPSIDLADGEIVKVGGDELKVLYTPGHAKGHVSFYAENDGFVLTGDTLFRRGVGRSDFPGGSYEQLENSLKNVLYKLPDDTIVYPGHGPTTTIGEERRNNYYITD
ncbi:MAG: MBL fold metallo-hydrolase [Bacteroidales bacterium]|nr:MBL fold metallo-hydrolase [Bacteroidales bacterium]